MLRNICSQIRLSHIAFFTLRVIAITFGMEMVACYVLDLNHAFAAMQGALGATSTGHISLSVTKTAVAQINGLNDMTATWTQGDADLVWTNDVCVYSSKQAGHYTVTAVGAASAGGAFVMTDGAKQLPYSVTWNDGGAGNLSNDGVKLQPNTHSATFSQAATDSPTCHGSSAHSPTARLVITVAENALQQVDAGNFTEGLTLIVSAD